MQCFCDNEKSENEENLFPYFCRRNCLFLPIDHVVIRIMLSSFSEPEAYRHNDQESLSSKNGSFPEETLRSFR